MQAESGDDAVTANPTRSGRIPKAKAKVAGAIKELLSKRPRKPTQKNVIQSSPSAESLTEVKGPVTDLKLFHKIFLGATEKEKENLRSRKIYVQEKKKWYRKTDKHGSGFFVTAANGHGRW